MPRSEVPANTVGFTSNAKVESKSTPLLRSRSSQSRPPSKVNVEVDFTSKVKVKARSKVKVDFTSKVNVKVDFTSKVKVKSKSYTEVHWTTLDNTGVHRSTLDYPIVCLWLMDEVFE